MIFEHVMRPRKTLVLIYNPVSGNLSFLQKLDFVIDKCQERGFFVVFYRTTKNDNERLPTFLNEIRPFGILIAGGDGTVHIVINLLLKNDVRVPIGILPSGTSNDLATYLGIKKIDEAYFDKILANNTRYIDTGKVNGDYFINVVSAGIFTSIAHSVDVRLKNALGKMAYYIHSLGEIPKIRSFPLHVELDGKVLEEDVYLFAVINSNVIGSMQKVLDGVKIDDGKLDLVLIKPCNFKVLMELTANLFAGKGISKKKEVVHLSAKKIFLNSAHALESDVDGEKGTNLPLKIEAIAAGIEVFC